MRVAAYSSVAFALFSILFLMGCAPSINLDGLHEIGADSSLPDYRVAGRGDTISESDVFEFSVTRGSDQCVTSLAARCDERPGSCAYTNGGALTLASHRPRTTGFVLDATRRVAISVASESPQRCKALSTDVTLNTSGLVGASWSEVRPRLESALTRPGFRLTVTRHRRFERHMLPGDRVRITAEYLVGGGDYGAQPRTFTDALSLVDDDGRLYIPPLSYPAPSPDPGDPLQWRISIGRAFGQQASSAQVRIAVWEEGLPFSRQLTVAQLERCLASRWGAQSDTSTNAPLIARLERERCHRLGVDGSTFVEDDIQNTAARYRLEVHQTWYVVLWDGRRLERAFMPGQTVAAGVRRAIRDATGRDSFPASRVYAAIDPRPELREDPFFARVDGETALASVLIAPGDIVHVSTVRPAIRRSP